MTEEVMLSETDLAAHFPDWVKADERDGSEDALVLSTPEARSDNQADLKKGHDQNKSRLMPHRAGQRDTDWTKIVCLGILGYSLLVALGRPAQSCASQSRQS